MKTLLLLGSGEELAGLYCFVFLLISAQGSGILSVDDSREAGSLMRRICENAPGGDPDAACVQIGLDSIDAVPQIEAK